MSRIILDLFTTFFARRTNLSSLDFLLKIFKHRSKIIQPRYTNKIKLSELCENADKIFFVTKLTFSLTSGILQLF